MMQQHHLSLFNMEYLKQFNMEYFKFSWSLAVSILIIGILTKSWFELFPFLQNFTYF